jgi:phage terminase large subunit
MPAKSKERSIDRILPIHFQPKQNELRQMVKATGFDAPTILGFGGPRGGGKSGGARRVMVERRLEMPGTDGVILRRVLQDLRDNQIYQFWKEWPELEDYYHGQTTEIRFPNDSKIMFRYAETLDDVKRKFWGPEYYDIFVDQAEQFTEEELRMIALAARHPNAPTNDPKTVFFINPGGVGAQYLRRVLWKKIYKADENPADFAFLISYGWDNYVWFKNDVPLSEEEFYQLPAEERFQIFIKRTTYGRKLNGLPAELRQGHLLGNFDVFSGQFFSGAWDDKLCVI